jgi:hypothetical protein
MLGGGGIFFLVFSPLFRLVCSFSTLAALPPVQSIPTLNAQFNADFKFFEPLGGNNTVDYFTLKIKGNTIFGMGARGACVCTKGGILFGQK